MESSFKSTWAIRVKGNEGKFYKSKAPSQK